MEITIPHNFTPRSYQLPVLEAFDSGIRYGVLIMHRRAGKDKTAWNLMIKKALERVGVYFYFLPTYSQAKKVIWDNIDKDGFKLLDHIPKELIKNKNETEMKIELQNGSVIQLLGADSYDRIVGTNPAGVVFSEYAIQKKEAWDYISPILRENKGWALFIYTPRGKNHGWSLYQIAKESDKWYCGVFNVEDTKAIDKEELGEEKKEKPQSIYQQEYMCKFLESATQVFRGVESVCVGNEEKYQPSHRYQIGVDLAKYEDFTVISVFDLMTFEQVEMVRFNQIDWNLQESKIESIYHKYGKPEVYIDATGVGDPIVENLEKKGIKVVPYKFTKTSREDLINNLAIKIESQRITLLNNQILKDELQSFSYEMSERGTIKMKVPDGLHDDTVFATALSVMHIPQDPMPVKQNNSVRFLTRNYKNNSQQRTSYE